MSALAQADVPVAATTLAVRKMPRSATPEEQLEAAGIDARAIVDAARELVKRQPGAQAEAAAHAGGG